ncbi:DUF1330 domain-containing protein [Chitinophaga parva]|uniref:DUF1330 domain-containing protein n=1 Tax=Chitinophaga parva TaxID=2169414 RepID=A0A2T7BEG8_9BACT|nr:DUF1330 domain-containing protein [Chitinophaga parva]PUZ23472.1 DUF1330 domain-containing protein [Chitinophaga parva]
MPAYVIIEVTILNPELIKQYQALAPATLAPFGGRYIARGGHNTTLEGGWEPQRMTLIEFPSVENAKAWWHSDAYSQARATRKDAATMRMVITEGL